MFYQHSNFSFSKEACRWALAQYSNKLNSKVAHVLDTIPDHDAQKQWSNSLIGQELNEFLSKYNLNTKQHGIGVFISNDTCIWVNPHIDYMIRNGKIVLVKSRFNVMILGNPNDTMVWWPVWTSDDARIIYNEYKDINNNNFYLPGIPGNTIEERCVLLGTPEITATFYQNNTSAFVKTDCAHTIYVSPEPRLIVTVGFDKSLEEIFN